MKTKEYKDTEDNVLWNFVEPENELDNQVINLLCEHAYHLALREQPETMKEFNGKVALHMVDGEVRIAFLHILGTDEKADEVINSVINQAQKEQNENN